MSICGMADHSNVSRILCRTCLCPQLQPLPSKASLHDLPWNTLRMARSRCSRMFFTVTLPLAARSTVSWNSCRRLAFSKAKQWVSAGCSSQVRRAGTYTTQILHRTQLARNLGPRCALQASNSRMGLPIRAMLLQDSAPMSGDTCKLGVVDPSTFSSQNVYIRRQAPITSQLAQCAGL